ncbi:AMP-binding protein [Novosphingobium taihuense]|nr:AMP-binding protein [Novosphingobium taihuense]TWH87139.1 bile acid-coenzyme A ligase [Novosphingobium taihuense]
MGMLLSAHAAMRGSVTALSIADRDLTFAELDSATNRLARRLASIGVQNGDTVMICMRNRVEFVQTFYAAWKLGAMPCPISFRLVASELAELERLVQPRVVVADIATAFSVSPVLEADALGLHEFSDEPLPPAVAEPGKIIASGGSTGRPKLTIDPVPSIWGPDKASTFRPAMITTVNAGPLYHTMPYNYCILPLAEGSTVVSMERFEPVEWLRLVEKHRPHSVNLVPTMMSRIAKLPETVTRNADLSSIEVLFHAAAVCPADVKRWWLDRIGPEKVLEVYGGTERIGSTMIRGDEWLAHPGSVGRPPPSDEIVIIGEDGRELPPGKIGEISFRRRGVGPGTKYRYIGSETRIRGELDSFGDMGWLDDDGYLYIADRRTDMVVVAGVNIFPAEIEAALERHPDILCCAVIGLPDDDLGNILHAIVELAEGTAAPQDAGEFLAVQLLQLAPFKRPRSFEFTQERLRDDAGKVRRGALRAARIDDGRDQATKPSM